MNYMPKSTPPHGLKYDREEARAAGDIEYFGEPCPIAEHASETEGYVIRLVKTGECKRCKHLTIYRASNYRQRPCAQIQP